MNERSRIAALALFTAVTLGILADLLLRVGPWGLNLTLWTLAVVLAVAALSASSPTGRRSRPAWPAMLVSIFALMFAWRDAEGVKLFNAFAMAVCLAVWLERREGERVRRWTIIDYMRGFLNSAIAAVVGPLALARIDLGWISSGSSPKLRYARSAALGLLIALPLLFFFGALLMAADAVFERMVTNALDFDIANVLSHGALTAFFAWIVAGFTLVVLNVNRRAFTELPVGRPGLGIVEVAVPLATIDLLFLTFVLVQLRYLFGDASLVEGTVGLTYSEYARRGFFELVTVVALVLPIMLAADWVLAESDRKSRTVYRLLAGTLMLLLLAIVASAVKRMLLYQSAYGLTEQRVYTTAFMTWLGIVLIWFAATVLRDRRTRFATGALLSGLLVIGAINFLNPDALIARVNTNRAAHGEEFDAAYAGWLSGDAVPVLVSALADLDPADRCQVAERLLERWSVTTNPDWRAWSLGRARALRVVSESRAQLQRWVCKSAPEPDISSETLPPPDRTPAP